jgi:hypothetical protein
MVLVSGLFGKKQLKETPVPLPPIAPLEAKADITDTWEAVERFPECLLVTDAILSNETKNYMVKEVVFNIESNDQGWCNEDNFEGEPHSVFGYINILNTVKVNTKAPGPGSKLQYFAQLKVTPKCH